MEPFVSWKRLYICGGDEMQELIFHIVYAVVMLLFGIYLRKAKNKGMALLFVTGDYSDLDASKVCTIVGRRFILFGVLLGLLIPVTLWKSDISFFCILFLTVILVILECWDFTKNRSKYI
jgi:hypothetical protein